MDYNIIMIETREVAEIKWENFFYGGDRRETPVFLSLV